MRGMVKGSYSCYVLVRKRTRTYMDEKGKSYIELEGKKSGRQGRSDYLSASRLVVLLSSYRLSVFPPVVSMVFSFMA